MGEIQPDKNTEVLAFALEVKDGQKFLYPGRGPVGKDLGVQNIKFILYVV